MEGIFGMIILTISVIVSILLYKSLMKQLNISSITIRDFEVIYKFMIPIVLSFIVMKYSLEFLLKIGFSSKSFVPYILSTIILILFYVIYEICLNIILKKLNINKYINQ